MPAVCQVAAYLVSCRCLPLHPKTLRSAIDRVRDLPCWRAAVRPRVLGGGLSNHNFVVEDGGARFVARIGGDAPAHNVMRFNEASCARAAAAVGLAPRVVHAADGALVIDFIDGRTLDAAAVRDDLPRILALLERVHADATREVRGPVLAFSVFHVARHYRRLLAARDSRHAHILPRLMAQATRLEAAVGPADTALCHNDLMAANFIDAGAALYLIDWEYAGFGAPLFDLANLASNNDFPADLEREMLARYYGAPVDNAAWRRYKALRAASHLRETLWSMTAEIVSDIEHDYATYTETNLADFARAFEAFEMAGSG